VRQYLLDNPQLVEELRVKVMESGAPVAAESGE